MNWEFRGNENGRPMYFSQMRVDPINPDNSDHLIIGNDGAIDVSYDQGETWEAFRRWAVGQPYHASVYMRRPYYVCTGLQDNGSWRGPSQVRNGVILSEDRYRVGGGFYTAVDPTDYTVVYSESQNGNIRRTSLETGGGRRHPAARAHGKQHEL